MIKTAKKPALPKNYKHCIPATSSKDKEITCIYLFVYWDEGGSSPLSETCNNPSGVAASFSPAMQKDGMVTYNAGAGLRYIAAHANRLNRKLILSVFNRILYEVEHKVGKAWDVLQRTCEREQLTLK